MKFRYQKGFTLIELLIAIAIVGILVAIAVPSYKRYTKRAHYAEVVQAAAPFKLGVEECYQMTGSLDECIAGKNGIPDNATLAAGLVDTIKVESEGKIIIIPMNKNGITAADTYELIPNITNGRLVWTTTGGGVAKGYAH